MIQCHVNNLFLMANSSTSFIQRLFIYRLMSIQFRFLIPISPLKVDDWSLWSNTTAFKCDYIAYTIASMVSTPFCMQHANFTSIFPDLTLPGHTPLYSCISLKIIKACLKIAYIAQLADKCDRSFPHKWYLDIKANTTLPDSHDRLYDRYVCSPSTISVINLVPGATTTQKNRHWLITLDGNDTSLFSKQLSVQPKKDTCCDVHVPFPSADKYTTVTPSCTFKISLLKSLILPINCERIQQNNTEVVSFCSYDDASLWPSSLHDSTRLPSPVILTSSSHYRFYTDEAATIYAALSVSLTDSTISIYTDSQAAIDGLHLCASSSYTNSRLYYKTTNFKLWASIKRSIHAKRLTIYPVKVKGHDGNYWNEFADSLTTSTHHSDNAILLPMTDYTSTHNVRLVYDDIVCESNPRRLLKLYYQATFMKDLLSLKRFQFTFCLYNRDDYVIDWELTWFTLNFSLVYDASFRAHHTSRHYTFKFKLFFDELPLLEKLKITHPDLYIDLLMCRSCHDRKEDLMHLILCTKRHPTPILRKFSSLSCWTISSSNWSSYTLIQGCLPRAFIDLFVDLSIPKQSAVKVVAAIHNNFVQKLRTRIWNLRIYDKCKWEDVMNITLKLKTTPRPSNLPATSYVPFFLLPPLTHLMTSRDSGTD
ncbi:hypothetical protein RclHR1_29310001 [Rhizophagus clarus]|uniref:RNase H type-1 domain-containing protein n=1 Tax=Rhizophagus clarus TaxID=94130 RepID=A0A2Z6R4K7_9GLOM|nr:hypothetical protein RclHR1_29310001 [Rhizophagus clarus]